mgnify:CR=1 FL=1
MAQGRLLDLVEPHQREMSPVARADRAACCFRPFLDLDRTGIGIGGPDEELGEVEAFGNEHQRDARIGDIAYHQQRDLSLIHI